jgi:hypothetical protein
VSRDEEAERVLRSLAARAYVVETVIEQTRTGRLAAARLRHRAYPEVYIDLLFPSSGIEPELVDAAERMQ